jgi:succinyl-diaminopimelate desuccinylase
MDTVPVGKEKWTYPPFAGEVHDGKIFGRGAADMKGGLACMIAAGTILAQSGIRLSGDLILALTFDETFGLEGAKRLIDGGYLEHAGALLVGEPSSLDVFVAEKGALWLQCTARGRTAHTSMPHLGSNAIIELAHFLIRLESELDLTSNHPLLGGGTYTVGTVQGGVTINVVPDQCEAQIDIRLCPGHDYEKIIHRVRQLAGETIDIEVIDWKPPVETDPGAEIAKISLGAVEKITGEDKSPKGVAYYTDGAVLANRLSIPMVIIGPADTGMTHQPDEYVDVYKLVQAVKIYLLIAVRYLT